MIESSTSEERLEPERIGQQVGNYRITRLLGTGGMGAVYEMVHQSIGQRAALKILFRKYSSEPEFIERFKYEAEVVNLVDHPGLVKISDNGQFPDGALYIIMELLQGQTLRARLEAQQQSLSGSPAQDVTFEIIRQIAETLQAVHARGVIHRDLKPENIFLVPEPAARHGERVKILDFGIAKALGPPLNATSESPRNLTTMGRLLGTPTYMSPEQCEGHGVLTTKSDVYALGSILFEMLTGAPPFSNGGANSIMAQHLLAPAPLLSSRIRNSNPVIEELLVSMLAKQPADRPELSTLIERIDDIRRSGPSVARARSTPLGVKLGLAVLSLFAAGSAFVWSVSHQVGSWLTAPISEKYDSGSTETTPSSVVSRSVPKSSPPQHPPNDMLSPSATKKDYSHKPASVGPRPKPKAKSSESKDPPHVPSRVEEVPVDPLPSQ